MPQLDVFTYVNISFYFFCSFFIFYIVVAYSIFPFFNFVQKSRFFFEQALAQLSLRKNVFDIAAALNNPVLLIENSSTDLFVAQLNINELFYASASCLFFLELELVYFDFARSSSMSFIRDILYIE